MLKRILELGVCPEDILNNISDEDKQLIFLEIRREQIRKYKLSLEAEKNEQFKHNPNKKGKNVGFAEESSLVSVLGERAGDKTIEEILEQEAFKKAELEAESEIQKELERIRDSIQIELVKEDVPPVTESKADEPLNSSETAASEPEKVAPVVKRTSKSLEQKRIEMVKRKSTELYQNYINHFSELNEKAEKEDEDNTKYWKQSEAQAKSEEEMRRKMAEEARKLHASMNNIIVDAVDISEKSTQKPPLPQKKTQHLRYVINAIQKANLAKSKTEIKAWFLEHEWNKLKIVDGSTDTVPLWFHGMICREEAEQLLEKKCNGTFLIRLSDKFQSYVLSYKSKTKVKHIIIESQSDKQCYKFSGPTNIRNFRSLAEMVAFFQSRSLNDVNGDTLSEPCGQVPGQVADYMCILQPDCNNSSASTVKCHL